MKCKSCGAEFDGKFCPYCGEKQVDYAVKENEVSVKNIDVQPKTKAKKPIYKKWWFWVIAILLLLGIIGSFGEDSSDNDASEFNWSNMTLGSMLPTPESTLGKNLINTEDYLSIDILDVSPDEYQKYVNGCREKGFTVEVSEYDTYYDAQNADGYKLMLYYFESDEEMSIDLNAPSENEKEETEQITSEKSDKEINNTNDTVQDETTTEKDSTDYIENFVSNYNKAAETPITERVKFDPKDRESGYYRTEYRLTAWDGSVGEAGSIGNAKIEMVNYGSYGGYYDNNSFRVYVTAESVDEILEIFPIMAKIIDPTVSDGEIQDTIEHVREYGHKNGLSIGNLSGYILGTEMMLE